MREKTGAEIDLAEGALADDLEELEGVDREGRIL